MKTLIASDIHGSALYCSMLLDRINAESPEKILLLGDILYHGPRNDLPTGYAPKQVIAMLNPLANKITCVRGNCDAEVDQMVLDFTICGDDIKLDLYGIRIYVTHGHNVNSDSLPDGFKGVLLYGHTHVPLNAVSDSVRCLNPGSVSIPKEGSPHSYMTLDENGFTWKTLGGIEYDRLVI